MIMKTFKQQSLKSVLFIWLSVLGLITGVQLVEENLDKRSKANSEVITNSICNLENFSVGSDFLCNDGKILWKDKIGSDGEYNWWCINDDGNVLGECAFDLLTDDLKDV